MAKLTPLPGFVLIEPTDDQETTTSGLVMPEKAKEKPGKGKLLALSPIIPIDAKDALILRDTTWTNEYKRLKPGDVVIYHKWAGNEIKDGNKSVVLVKFGDLQGVYE